MALIDDFKAQFPPPAFATATVNSALPRLESLYSLYYNATYDPANVYDAKAILYCLAHLLEVDQSPSASQFGQLTNNSAGNVSGSFRGKQDASDFISFFGATKYGQQFLLIIKSRQGGVSV